ncbi:MAG TPA: hypothetical protein VKZ49_08700 [Polyangiaceae bacterium]|nr:hypothetical protein [Polyangiaceae bacterium]
MSPAVPSGGTTGAPTTPLRWRARYPALAPVAALAAGAAAAALLRRLLDLDEARRGRLRGVRFPGAVLILAAEADLPWVDGIRYFGRDPAAPSLLLPTALEPDVPVALLERAVLQRAARDGHPDERPWLVTAEPPQLLSAANARPLGPAELRAASEPPERLP